LHMTGSIDATSRPALRIDADEVDIDLTRLASSGEGIAGAVIRARAGQLAAEELRLAASGGPALDVTGASVKISDPEGYLASTGGPILLLDVPQVQLTLGHWWG